MITLFSWGYWGWGNATEQLVESADLAEKKRGFKPPVFVDIRRERQGRAKGLSVRPSEKSLANRVLLDGRTWQ